MAQKKRRLPSVGKCFDHLGGKLAPILFNRLIEKNWLKVKEGKKTVFDVPEKGKKNFKEVFDIDIDILLAGEE